ncbi:MAG: hypothetical protein NT154_45825 [Verrucomicrobia bacterium]|nr:hypothetical protein [Verrucomicrobiota bacterium]
MDLLRWWGSQPPQLLLAENAMEKVLLLSTDLPVQQVGRLTGFPNAQHFSIRLRKMARAFRRNPRHRFPELNPQEE